MALFGVSFLMNMHVEEDILVRSPYTDISFVLITKMTPDKVTGFFPEHFTSLLGYDDMNNLSNGSICFFDYRNLNNPYISSDELFSMARNQSSLLRNLFETLWLKKDNSFFVLKSLVYRDGDRYYSESPLFGYSNSKGKYTQSILTQEEVSAVSLIETNKDNLLKNIKTSTLVEVGDKQISVSPNNYLYSYFNRFERVLYFLHEARSTSFQMMKIFLYASIFENLVVTSKESVTSQIKQRVFWIISKYSGAKHVSRKKIERIYKYRSLYVHGAVLSEKELSKLNVVCEEADMVSRMLLNAIIGNDELKETVSLNTEDLERWFVNQTVG